MKPAPIPADESARQDALDGFKILDTPPDPALDQLVQMAQAICEVPIALISLVDRDRQWFKARQGLEATQTGRGVSFCGHAILQDEIFEIEDARQHPDFCDNPLVTGDPRVCFYAGAPLLTPGPSGSVRHRIGTICVVDHVPRKLTPLQRQALECLAKQVVSYLELKQYKESVQTVHSQLEEAQRISKIGSWQYNLVTEQQSWSSEHYRIFEIAEPQPKQELYRLYRSRIHPEDLPELDRLIQRAIHEGQDFIYDHRVWLDEGKRIKYVQGIGKVIRDSSGKPAILNGTCRDKTEDVQNESRYRLLIETMNEGVVIQDTSGKIIDYNPAALRILGLSADQLLGRTSMDPKWRAHKEDGSDFPGNEHPAMVALATGKPVSDVTMGLRLPDDAHRWILINAVPQEGPRGRTVTTTFADITALVEAREEIRFMLDALGIGIWKFNPGTQELYWDPSMYRLYECQPHEFNGHYEAWQSLLTPEARTRTLEEVAAALSGKHEFNTTFEIRTPAGKKKHIAARAKVVIDEKGVPALMYGINWDRSKEVEMETFVQQERAKALHAAKLASLGEMAAGIAHEINNPLAIIAGNIHLLPSIREHSEKFLARLEALDKATNRIAKIVGGLRKFSRSSTETERKTVSVSDVIAEALVLTESKAKRHSVEVEAQIQTQRQLLCDPVEMEQVLVNLINNGIDAASQSDEKWVLVRVLEENGDLVLQVQDSGKGISSEVEQKLFQPFFTTKAVGEGTGLGLSISKGILEQHGASIALNRRMPCTCFEIRFSHA
ncbi:MAG: PAS domain-containing protein [Oligoflexia bacterium]